jgi:hypothetical protein
VTVHVHYELCCDADGCYNAYAPSVEEIGSLVLTRRGARTAGWTRVVLAEAGRRDDRCPEHPAR